MCVLSQRWTGAIAKIAKLFYFGRLDVHHKGLDLLLSAFAEVAALMNARLTFQGPNGDGHQQLRLAVKQLHISDNATHPNINSPNAAGDIVFLKPDYSNPPSSIIGNYDIFCMPSRFEGFGLAALEAMLAARVLLVSEESGIASHVKASGCRGCGCSRSIGYQDRFVNVAAATLKLEGHGNERSSLCA